MQGLTFEAEAKEKSIGLRQKSKHTRPSRKRKGICGKGVTYYYNPGRPIELAWWAYSAKILRLALF